MGDETPNTVNLDLSLGQGINTHDNESQSGLPSAEPMNLEEHLFDRAERFRESLMRQRANLEDYLFDRAQRFRESLMRQRASRQRLGQQWQSAWRPHVAPPIPPQTGNLGLGWMGGAGLELGEGSAPPIPPQTRNHGLGWIGWMGGVGLEVGEGSAPPIPPQSIPSQRRNLGLGLMGDVGLELGEGSIAREQRADEESKLSASNNERRENQVSGKKDDAEKNNGEGGSFFDCNICLDQAREPVVTSCGHLFCWPCLYQWLHLHSYATECPVCKGHVTRNNLTPIYGRGNDKHKGEDKPTLQIPQRPQAQRIEGWRQAFHRNAFSIPIEEMIPMEEMIRRTGNRHNDPRRDMAQPNSTVSHSRYDTSRTSTVDGRDSRAPTRRRLD